MPADYVNKLARMFQDVKVSEDLNQHFKDVHRNKASLAGKFIRIYFKYIYYVFFCFRLCCWVGPELIGIVVAKSN